jgi:hypothetical protein
MLLALTAEEVGHFRQSARRIAAILLLGTELDGSYRACAAAYRLPAGLGAGLGGRYIPPEWAEP